MLLGICLGILCGVGFGIITGLAPGVHINLVSAILLSLSPALAQRISLVHVCALIMAMSVTHTFLDTIPSIFLGAPDDDKALGVLPGHRYLLRGNGMAAVKLCIIGGLLGAVVSVVLFVPLGMLLNAAYAYGRPYMVWILIALVLFTILKDKKRPWALAIFLLSGLLGLIVLRLPISDPLLPLLSGMFGTATLLYSINEHQRIPPQNGQRYTEIDLGKTASGTVRGVLAGMVTSLLPGISASAASAVTSRGGRLGDSGFLVLLGSIGSAGFILSLASFLYFEKARNGAMAVITELSAIDTPMTVILLSAALVGAGIAALLTLWMGRSAAAWLPKLPYRATCAGVILFVALLAFLRSGWVGLAVLATSTAIGLLPAAVKTARAQAMGCLLLPVIVMLW
jgi:putative membrane protein